jgi:hypothetical protein
MNTLSKNVLSAAVLTVLMFTKSAVASQVQFLKIKDTAPPLDTALQICKTVADIAFDETYGEFMRSYDRKPGELTMAIQDKAVRYARMKRNTGLVSCLLEQGYVVKQ